METILYYFWGILFVGPSLMYACRSEFRWGATNETTSLSDLCKWHLRLTRNGRGRGGNGTGKWCDAALKTNGVLALRVSEYSLLSSLDTYTGKQNVLSRFTFFPESLILQKLYENLVVGSRFPLPRNRSLKNMHIAILVLRKSLQKIAHLFCLLGTLAPVWSCEGCSVCSVLMYHTLDARSLLSRFVMTL